MVVLFGLNDGEGDGFAPRDAFQEPEVAFGITPTTGRRHTVFQHFYEIKVQHLGFLVTGVTHRLLFFKAGELVQRVVKLTIAVAHFGAGDDGVEALGDERAFGDDLGEGAEAERFFN